MQANVNRPANPVPLSPPSEAPNLGNTVLRVAWLSILLGLAIEAMLIVLATISGTLKDAKPFVADLVQKISWSTIVCVGIALGKAATKMQPQVMGLMGLLAAPTGFAVARTLHKGATEALKIAEPAAGGVSPFLIGAVKGLQYACLGALAGWIGKQSWGRALAHITIGLGVGIVFGGTILGLTDWFSPTPLPLVALLSRGINEIVFPIGCSLVLYAAENLGKRLG